MPCCSWWWNCHAYNPAASFFSSVLWCSHASVKLFTSDLAVACFLSLGESQFLCLTYSLSSWKTYFYFMVPFIWIDAHVIFFLFSGIFLSKISCRFTSESPYFISKFIKVPFSSQVTKFSWHYIKSQKPR